MKRLTVLFPKSGDIVKLCVPLGVSPASGDVFWNLVCGSSMAAPE